MFAQLIKTNVYGSIVAVCLGNFNSFLQGADSIFPAADFRIGACQLIVRVAIIRCKFQRALAETDGPERFLHFQNGVGLVA